MDFRSDHKGGSNLKRVKLTESRPKAWTEKGKPEELGASAGAKVEPGTGNPISLLLPCLVKL
jgi:hypothetical protein